MSNIEVFINHGHQSFEFLKDIKQDYENTITNQYHDNNQQITSAEGTDVKLEEYEQLDLKKEIENKQAEELEESQQSSGKRPLAEAELINKVREMFLNKLSEANLKQIRTEHELLSEGLGRPIGLILD